MSGLVTAVDGSSFTVAATVRTGAGVGSSASANTENVQVSTTSTTAYTERKAVVASAAKVGRCARADGTTDSTGALTARTVALSSPVNGVCTQGFGVRPSGSRTGG